MKPIVMLLLLANLLFLAWAQWLAPRDDARSSAPVDAGVPTLRLASEARETSGSSAAPDSAASPGPETAPATEQASPEISPALQGDAVAPSNDGELLTSVSRCLSIGSFRTLAEATQASATLRTGGYEPRARVAEGDVWAGLWVSLRQLPSRTEAQRAVALLKQRGVSDAYLMPAAGGTTEISLGIFSDPVRAQRRADDVKAMGFTPTISDRTRRGTVYWIDIDLKPTDSMIQPSDLQPESGKIVRLGVQACPPTDSAG